MVPGLYNNGPTAVVRFFRWRTQVYHGDQALKKTGRRMAREWYSILRELDLLKGLLGICKHT